MPGAIPGGSEQLLLLTVAIEPGVIVAVTGAVQISVLLIDSTYSATIVTAGLPCGTRTSAITVPFENTLALIISTFWNSDGEVLCTVPMRPLSHVCISRPYIIRTGAMAMSMSSKTATKYDIDLLKADVPKNPVEDESSKVLWTVIIGSSLSNLRGLAELARRPDVNLTWCGHSYFVIEAQGRRIAVDPHDGDSLGLPRCRVSAELVLVTHDHYDHNAVELVSSPTARVVRWSPASLELGWASVRGVRLAHDDKNGSLFGFVVAYVISVGGLTIVHLGDVGEPSAAAQKVGRADVVIVPAGDVTTVDQAEALRWAEALGARLIVPAHYWVRGSNVPLDPLDKLLGIWRGRVLRPGTNSFELREDALPPEPALLVLEPPPGPSS